MVIDRTWALWREFLLIMRVLLKMARSKPNKPELGKNAQDTRERSRLSVANQTQSVTRHSGEIIFKQRENP